MKYKINDNGEIEKTEFTETLTKEDFTSVLENGRKKLKEMLAQQKIYKAKAANVAKFHPFVLEMEDEKRNAIWLYQENHVATIQSQDIIDKLEDGIKKVEAEMEEITKQTGFSFTEEKTEETVNESK